MRIPVRFLKFCTVGFSGAIVDMTVFWILCELARWPVARAKCVSVEAAILNNFLWNDLWTFADIAGGAGTSRLRRLFMFNAICLGGLVLSLFLIFVQVSLLALNRYLANGVSIILVTAWNFGMNRAFSWTAPVAEVERTA